MQEATRTILRGAGALACVAVALLCGSARADDGYPDKPVRIIVPYPPAGFNDVMARAFATKLNEKLGQPFIVENRAGGGTVIGTAAAAKAPADGYTLLVQGFPLIVNQYLYSKLPYDTNTAFAPVILGAETPNLLVVRADSAIKSLKDLIDAAKASPGRLNYASSGTGTSQHLTMEYLKSITGTDLNQIPYKGSAPMVTDLLGGQVDVMFDNFPNALPFVKAGKMRALAVTSRQRLAELPDVPTVAEQGYPGFEVAVFYGLYAPAGTPDAVVHKLNAVLNEALKADDVKSMFKTAGVQPMGGSAQDFAKYNAAQDRKWADVIRKAGIKAD
ncbi:tripartite tricarboxylate transporter substrate binding protein [Pigmentiphaga soli]|uniref:Tripartite tricarboxylate transporter substrate binding protein n=2 Tax=Pigmentiphaga soli TaxID=1007095 RepID=A0ABP8H2D9_9BURK